MYGILFHSTECSFDIALRVLTTPGGNSAHYLIAEDGRIVCLVDPANVAYHAAAFGADPSLNRNRPVWMPAYTGRYSATNAATIGIELAGFAHLGFTELQYGSLSWLTAKLCREWEVPPTLLPDHGTAAALTTHGYVQSDRTDPGPYFLWSRLRAGLAEHLTPTPVPEEPDVSPEDAAILDVMHGLNANAGSIEGWINQIGAQEATIQQQQHRIQELEAAGAPPSFDPYQYRVELVNTQDGARHGFVPEQ